MFVLLLHKISTDTLKIYDMPNIYNKIPKYCKTRLVTITIYQANFMFQLYLAFELYPY